MDAIGPEPWWGQVSELLLRILVHLLTGTGLSRHAGSRIGGLAAKEQFPIYPLQEPG